MTTINITAHTLLEELAHDPEFAKNFDFKMTLGKNMELSVTVANRSQLQNAYFSKVRFLFNKNVYDGKINYSTSFHLRELIEHHVSASITKNPKTAETLLKNIETLKKLWQKTVNKAAVPQFESNMDYIEDTTKLQLEKEVLRDQPPTRDYKSITIDEFLTSLETGNYNGYFSKNMHYISFGKDGKAQVGVKTGWKFFSKQLGGEKLLLAENFTRWVEENKTTLKGRQLEALISGVDTYCQNATNGESLVVANNIERAYEVAKLALVKYKKEVDLEKANEPYLLTKLVKYVATHTFVLLKSFFNSTVTESKPSESQQVAEKSVVPVPGETQTKVTASTQEVVHRAKPTVKNAKAIAQAAKKPQLAG